jgi:2-polyprenyl-3-methyl-5-hydroxy-6-metoxy-1,4-benzoquinol methylase
MGVFGEEFADPLMRSRRDFPDPAEDIIEHIWWNKHADLIERVWANDLEIREALRKKYLSNACLFLTDNTIQPGTIFEVGSGSGWVGRLLIKGTIFRLLGMDLSEAQVMLAKQEAEKEGLSGQCEYVCTNISEASQHLREYGSVSGLLIHAILHHLTWSEINQIFSDITKLNFGAKLFVYEPVFFESAIDSKKNKFFNTISGAMAIFVSFLALALMKMIGAIASPSIDPVISEKMNLVSDEAIANNYVLSPKEVVFEYSELIRTIDKYFVLKESHVCNYLDISAAYLASIMQQNSLFRIIIYKIFIPLLRFLDVWLASTGAINKLCCRGKRGYFIDKVFPRYCFWGINYLPKNY